MHSELSKKDYVKGTNTTYRISISFYKHLENMSPASFSYLSYKSSAY